MAQRSVGIWYNETKESCQKMAGELARVLKSQGVQPVLSVAREGGDHEPCQPRQLEDCEFLCVLGGDGTILTAVDAAWRANIPILGVNMGRVGYLSEVQPDHINRDIGRVLAGEGWLDERMILKASTSQGESRLALNEVAINRSDRAVGIITLKAMSQGSEIATLAGDGLLAATATGSTGYSLSAGGPLAAPGMGILLLTPICPHTLHARPLVVPAEHPVTIRVMDGANRARVLLDGFKSLPLPQDDPVVTIQKCERPLAFLRLAHTNFFDLMHHKLSQWNQ